MPETGISRNVNWEIGTFVIPFYLSKPNLSVYDQHNIPVNLPLVP